MTMRSSTRIALLSLTFGLLVGFAFGLLVGFVLLLVGANWFWSLATQG
jgi:thiamine transporter ThiT